MNPFIKSIRGTCAPLALSLIMASSAIAEHGMLFALLSASPPAIAANVLTITNYINAADYPTLQAAVDALPEKGGAIFLPPGTYTLDAPLNLAETYQTGDSVKWITLQGSGKNNTIITGHFPGSVIVDATRSSYMTVRDLTVTGTAKCLWLSARRDGLGGGGNYFERVRFLGTNCTVALALICSEVNRFVNCDIQTDQPNAVSVLFSYSNLYNISSPYSTISDLISTTDLEFFGTTIANYGTDSIGIYVGGPAANVQFYGGTHESAGLASIYLDGTVGNINQVNVHNLRIDASEGRYALYAKDKSTSLIVNGGSWEAGGELIRYESVDSSMSYNWNISNASLTLKEKAVYPPGAGGPVLLRIDSAIYGTFKNITGSAFTQDEVPYIPALLYASGKIQGCDISVSGTNQVAILGNNYGNLIEVLSDSGPTRRMYHSGGVTGTTLFNMAPTVTGNVSNVQPGDFIMLRDGNGAGIPCPAYYDGTGWKKLIGQ